MNPIIELLSSKAKPLQPNAAFPPAGSPDSWAWIVTKGSANTYYSARGESHLQEPLTYLFELHAGAILFDIGLPLVLQNLGDCEVCSVDRVLFETLLNQRETAKPLGDALENRLTIFSEILYPELPPGKTFPLTAGSISKLKRGSTVSTNLPFLWVRVNRGRAFRHGLQQEAQTSESGFYPLAQHAWLTLESDCELEAHTTIELAQHGIISRDLEPLLCKMGIHLRQQHDSNQLASATFFKNRTLNQKHRLEQSIHRMAEILHKPVVGQHPSDGEALFDACRLVARSMDIEVPLEARPELNHPNPLQAIAKVSGFRTRKITLHSRWWHNQKSPLLGFQKSGKVPAALIPAGNTIQMTMPGHSPIAMNATIDNQLTRHAYQFYQPLPTAKGPWGLMQFLRKNIRPWLGLIALCALLGSLVGIIFPLAMSHTLNRTIPDRAVGQIWVLLMGLVAVGLTTVVFSITRSFASFYLENHKAITLRAAVWDRLLSLPLDFFRNSTSGDLLTRVDAVNGFGLVLLRAAASLIMSSIFCSFYLALLFFYSSGLAMASIVLVVFALVPAALVPRLISLQTHYLEREGFLSGQLQQMVLGVSKLRSAAAEDRAQAAWGQDFAEKELAAYKMGRLENLINCWNADFHNFSRMVLFTSLVMLLLAGSTMPVGDFIAFSSAFAFLIAAINDLSGTFVTLSTSAPAYHRAKPILQSALERTENKPHPGTLSGAIRVNQLCFRYESKGAMVLDHVDFDISANKMLAIVGPSGCGKSTLVRLLLGFEQSLSGAIYFDNKPMTDFDISGIREQMGVVLQKGGLFLGTILENILGAHDKTEQEAWEAVTLAGVDEDIKALPMGMHTFLSEGGHTLSGGQIQRLLIARALIAKPRILILDEATSALDNQTQARVATNLAELPMTRIVIAHRLTTIQNADTILVMEKGQIRQQGTYEALMAQKGTFQNLVKAQLLNQ